jgi:hypothetical protein
MQKIVMSKSATLRLRMEKFVQLFSLRDLAMMWQTMEFPTSEIKNVTRKARIMATLSPSLN